jgi:hypothetical protein
VAAVLVAVNLESPSPVPAAEPFASPNPVSIQRQLPLSQPASYQQSMNRYLQRHSQLAGAVGQKGFVSPLPIIVTVPEQVVETDDGSAESAEAPPRDAGRRDQP